MQKFGESRRITYLGLLLVAIAVNGLKHSFKTVRTDRTLIGPVGVPFGFMARGHYKLQVFDFELTVAGRSNSSQREEIINSVEAGFLLKRFANEAAFHHQLELWMFNTTICSFENYRPGNSDSAPASMVDRGIFLSMKARDKWKTEPSILEYTFREGEDGLYFLIYQVCPHHHLIRSTFELDFHCTNQDPWGRPSYLPAGEVALPRIYFFFSVSYLICWVIWFMNIRAIQQGNRPLCSTSRSPTMDPSQQHQQRPPSRPAVYAIHQLMSVLIVLKFLSVFSESLRYHAIRVWGHAEFWSVVYYFFTFLKGSYMFTILLLIGSGWSFVKPFLNQREKIVIFLVILLQLVNNVALIVLSDETEGERSYDRWTATLHLVDILCCCAVLMPIVWQVNSLEKSIGASENDGDEDAPTEEELERELEESDKGHILTKLKLFRSFYLLVIGYIYATRILIYMFVSVLDYKHLWVRHFVVELLTLTFYVSVGVMFRPMEDNPYLSVKREEEPMVLQDGLEMELAER